MNIARKTVLRHGLPALICGLSLIPAAAVRADDVNYVVNTSPLIFQDASIHDLIRLQLVTTAVTELVITHSFECAVEGNDRVTWFDTDILVDGLIVAPTNSDNASCTSTPPDTNSPALDDWETTSQTVVRVVGGGIHLVVVRGSDWRGGLLGRKRIEHPGAHQHCSAGHQENSARHAVHGATLPQTRFPLAMLPSSRR
jgi:hypothetical protein